MIKVNVDTSKVVVRFKEHNSNFSVVLSNNKGDKGDPGKKGDKGDGFRYEDFTPEQLNALRRSFNRVLTSEDDLDDIIEDGTYPYSTASIPQHCDFSNAGIVEVAKADSDTTRIIQRVTRYGTGGMSAFRTLYEGKWNDWTEVATIGDITFSSKDVTTKNTNLDDYRTSGCYFFTSSYTPTNAPSANGFLLVIANEKGTMVKQVWFRAGTINSNDHQTKQRTYLNSGTWSNWHDFSVTS